MSTVKMFFGVSELIDLTDDVLQQNGFAVTVCERCSKSFNVCECELEDELEGQHDSELAADADVMRWPR